MNIESQLIEIRGDLFEADGVKGFSTPRVPIVHCISADYVLGAGIAKKIEKRYKIKQSLRIYGSHKYPDCLVVNNIINLVTKDIYYNKPHMILLNNHCTYVDYIVYKTIYMK